jgi:hypothetical protein
MSDEEDDRDDSDTPPVDDRYPRTKAVRSAGASVKHLVEALGLADAMPQRDEAWWAERGRQLDELKAREAADAERVRMRRRATALEARGGFPAMYVQAALNAPSDTPAMRHAENFRHLPAKIILFAGGVGAGKSTAAVWLCTKAEDLDPASSRASELERRGRYDKQLGAWLNERRRS